MLGFAQSIPMLYNVVYIYLILMVAPSFNATVKRLHDVGKSGKWMLWLLLPAPGFLVIFLYVIGGGEENGNLYGCRLEECA